MNFNVILKDFNFMREQINNEDVYKSSDNCDYGLDYHIVLKTLNIEPNAIKTLEFKTFSFIKALLYELDKRLPDNLGFFQKLQLFSPKQCLNQLHPSFIVTIY